jgi:hypothetical protein
LQEILTDYCTPDFESRDIEFTVNTTSNSRSIFNKEVMMRIGLIIFAVFMVTLGTWVWADPVPTTLNDFFFPGSQPGQSGNLQHPGKCDNCHGGYDQSVEPAFNWRGSMMAQAARDPLFYACLAIANQDAPESGDLCIRCHSPDGWLNGRSIPTDGSALNNNDREGVQCDFCHKLVKPSDLGTNPYPGDPDYTNDTYPQDQSYLAKLGIIPDWSANGMYIADDNNAKRGPFIDAAAKHQMLYSPFHQDANLCGTCHDVSNPVYTRNESGKYVPNAFNEPAPDFDLRTMFPIERTFSEWQVSDYNTPSGVYAPQFGGNKDYVSTCQDCHMHDVTGVGCNKRGAPTRTDLPLHDLTGGNTFIPRLLGALFPDEIDQATLDAGIQRATRMLESAATLSLSVTEQGSDYLAHVRVTNETGHKLPSGYPEGRRIWLNVKAYDVSANLIYESGAYDFDTAVLTHDTDIKVYEIEPGISNSLAPVVNLPAGKSFHFVLNDTIYKDNRIPPRGFTNANFETIQSEPVDYSYGDGEYWDDTDYLLPGITAYVEVTLYYQTISKDYVEFLQSENRTNDWGNTFYDLWAANGKSAPVVMGSENYTITPFVDNEPPSAPTNLRATAVTHSQIDLVWNASTDNIGVAGYYVYRDGVEVADVPDTTYQDTGLLQQTTYSYFVKAYDLAGNISDPSNTASARTKRKKGKGGKGAGGPGEIIALDIITGPNPFKSEMQIRYFIPDEGVVNLDLYNIAGQRVVNLREGWHTAGEYRVSLSSKNLSSGIYLLRLNTGENRVVKKLILLK